VIFCKRPKLHQGKQRLVQTTAAQQGLSPEDALTIANSLLNCALEDANAWQGRVVLACSSDSDIDWAQALLPQALVIAQLPPASDGNLGQRLNHVDQQLRLLGHQQTVVIGTDAPMLTTAHFQDVLVTLQQHDIALSDADDGGVVIMANRCPWPNITELPWSTEQLSTALAQSCIQQGLTVGLAMPGYDIDHVVDLKRLASELNHDKRPARQHLLTTIDQILVSSGVTNHA